MKERTILLDSDIVAYQVAVRYESTFDFGDEGEDSKCHAIDRDAALQDIHATVEALANDTRATRVIVCLSDPDANFRKDLDPTYKLNRKDVVKPALLQELKDILGMEYESYQRPALEADDVMGILATNKKIIQGEKVIVSADKDMRTIPGKLYNPNKSELGILDISELDADRFHLWQTMCGDQTDGYPGCPKIGPKSVYAEEIIGADRNELWDIVLEAYALRGRTEEDAVHQARLARILRSQDWDYKRSQPRLWSPLTIYGGYEDA